jgi:phenylacetate-CoA ligase
MGMTMGDAPGMYLMEDEMIFEIASDHLLVTNLFNEALPLIRYRMDDVLVPVPGAPGSWPFRRIQEVVGRTEQALTFLNRHGVEDFIHPIVIVELIIEGLKAWQIVLLGKTSFRFRAQFEEGLTEAETGAVEGRIHQRVREILLEKEMGNVVFEIEPVARLEVDPHSGKFRLVERAAEYGAESPGI